MNNTVKIIDKSSGEIKNAIYAATTTGNLRYHVDGKPLSDTKFNALYEIHSADGADLWKVNTVGLLKEILNNNPNMAILAHPLQIFSNLLAEVADRVKELNDPRLMALMCRLALFEESDPYSKSYDKEMTEQTIYAGYPHLRKIFSKEV